MTYQSYYTVQDENVPNSSWSVCAELWEDDMWAEGEPIDGSQRHVVSLSSENVANRFASELYEMFGGKL